MNLEGPYDGTWGNDPLDLRCIRLDAEMEARHESSKPLFEKPTNFNELKALAKDRDNFEIYKVRTCPPECFRKGIPYLPCDILDKDMNIVSKCHNPVQAIHQIRKLVQTNDGHIEDYCILNLRTLHCIPLHEVMT